VTQLHRAPQTIVLRRKRRTRRKHVEYRKGLLSTKMKRRRRKKKPRGNVERGEKGTITAVRTQSCLISKEAHLDSLEEETLEDDDLELLEENTGGAFRRKSRLTRLRHRDSESPPAASSSKRRAVVESSDDDLDNEERQRDVPDIGKIWDDERRGDDDDDELSDFIEYSDEDEGVAMNEEARAARKQEKHQEQIRRKRARVRPELAGIDAKYVFPFAS